MNLHRLDKRLGVDQDTTVNNNNKQLADENLEEVEQAKAFIAQRRELYLIAHKERMDNWFATHTDKKYFEETHDEFVRDCKFEEWSWYLIQRLQDSPEKRFQQIKNKIDGFGHEGVDGGADSTECLPSCRFYPPEGRIEDIEVLEDYRDFQGFNEVYRTWKQLDSS